MSLSVDDLVASMSSNHIGQDAMDVAALQAQLRQTLFAQPMSAATSSHRLGTTTPICCTPTSTSFWERPDFDRRRSNSVASAGSRQDMDEYESIDAMDEDERMVEDMLFDASPAPSAVPSYPASQMPPASPAHYARHSRKSSVSSPFSSVHYDVPPANSASLFATTDPFYLAQLAATQNTGPTSFFSQFGKPAQQSPFLKGHPFAHRQNASEVHPTTAFVR